MRKFLLPVITSICLIAVLLLIDSLVVSQSHLSQLDSVKTRLNELTNRLSSVISQRLQLTDALVAFVQTREDFSDAEFQAFAESASARATGVLALQLAPDGVVRHTTDLHRNSNALGHDLLADPARRRAVERAIEQKAMIVAGPLRLLQGGRAVIARQPIFISRYGEEQFWGLATVLLDVGQLFLDAGLTRGDDQALIAVRGVDGLGANGEVFFGDPDVFEERPVLATVQLPNGSWQVGAILAEHSDWNLQRILLWCVFSVVGPLLFWLLYRMEREPEMLKERIHVATTELQEAYVRAESANKSKSEFLANMSHELRTPLNAIMGFNGLISESSRDQESRHYASLALASSQHLLALVNDLLDIARIEAVGPEIQPEPFRLRELMGVINENMKSLAHDGAVDVAVRVEDAVPDVLEGDRMRLTQVLMNFVSNAVKFTDVGQVHVAVRMLTLQEGKATLRFEVRDTGRGIPADKLNTIFDKFQQVDSSDTREHGGTGLGLTICRSLVDAMGGSLFVESVEEQGSLFAFEITLAVLPEETLSDEQAAYWHESSDCRTIEGVSILVVDDNAINRKVAMEILRREGAEVVSAKDGAEAIDYLATADNSVDLVLMDVQMPVMGGLEATRRLRHVYGFSKPIVGLSANAGEDDIRASLEAGMDDHLCKPFQKAELIEVIHGILATRC